MVATRIWTSPCSGNDGPTIMFWQWACSDKLCDTFDANQSDLNTFFAAVQGSYDSSMVYKKTRFFFFKITLYNSCLWCGHTMCQVPILEPTHCQLLKATSFPCLQQMWLTSCLKAVIISHDSLCEASTCITAASALTSKSFHLHTFDMES